jgi:hypothetical protein
VERESKIARYGRQKRHCRCVGVLKLARARPFRSFKRIRNCMLFKYIFIRAKMIINILAKWPKVCHVILELTFSAKSCITWPSSLYKTRLKQSRRNLQRLSTLAVFLILPLLFGVGKRKKLWQWVLHSQNETPHRHVGKTYVHPLQMLVVMGWKGFIEFHSSRINHVAEALACHKHRRRLWLGLLRTEFNRHNKWRWFLGLLSFWTFHFQ